MIRLRSVLRSRPGGALQWRSVLVLNAAQFWHIVTHSSSRHDAAYKDDPLSAVTEHQRARILQRACLRALTALRPHSQFSDAPAGLCKNGARRGKHQSEFDYLCDGRNVECKSTRMFWVPVKGCWEARWKGIKFHQEAGRIHDLVLALHSPGRVDVLLHDHMLGVGSAGAGQGYSVQVYARRGLHDAPQACNNILQKMQEQPGACLKIAAWETRCSPLSDLILAESVLLSNHQCANCYSHKTPLSGKTGSARALCLQRLAFEVDRLLHPAHSFQNGVGAGDVIGLQRPQRRGVARGSADWLRDSVRVEFKSSKLHWNVSKARWLVHFSEVKCAAFDELWLGLYSPFGVHFIKHSGKFEHAAGGLESTLVERAITIQGSRKDANIADALSTILAKLENAGSTLLAIINW